MDCLNKPVHACINNFICILVFFTWISLKLQTRWVLAFSLISAELISLHCRTKINHLDLNWRNVFWVAAVRWRSCRICDCFNQHNCQKTTLHLSNRRCCPRCFCICCPPKCAELSKYITWWEETRTQKPPHNKWIGWCGISCSAGPFLSFDPWHYVSMPSLVLVWKALS